MTALVKLFSLLMALAFADVAFAQTPSDQTGPKRPSTIGTGSCSGLLGAEPGCRSTRGASAGNIGANDHATSDRQATDQMGPNSIGRGGNSKNGSGADGLGDSESEDDHEK